MAVLISQEYTQLSVTWSLRLGNAMNLQMDFTANENLHTYLIGNVCNGKPGFVFGGVYKLVGVLCPVNQCGYIRAMFLGESQQSKSQAT